MSKRMYNNDTITHKNIGGRIKMSKKVYNFLFRGADDNDNNKKLK